MAEKFVTAIHKHKLSVDNLRFSVWLNCPHCGRGAEIAVNYDAENDNFTIHCELCVDTCYTPYHISRKAGVKIYRKCLEEVSKE